MDRKNYPQANMPVRRQKMDLKFGDIQETALIPLAIKASETARTNAGIKDLSIHHYKNREIPAEFSVGIFARKE